jgi:hypothetical protein
MEKLVRYYSTKLAKINMKSQTWVNLPQRTWRNENQNQTGKKTKEGQGKLRRAKENYKLLMEEVGGRGHRVRV